MKKWILLVVAVLMVVSLAGCSSKSGEQKQNGNGNDNVTETQQWAAYAFGDTVQPTSGGTGKIKSFTIDSVDSSEGKVREFTIEGTYLGKETVQIETQKMVIVTSPYSSTTTTVSASLECYKVKHHVTVVKDETGDTHPTWADITVRIPTDNFETTTQYFWIYPKATYVDSDNHTGEWSYYLTEAMQTEMQNQQTGTTVLYTPVVEGDFYGYDGWTFYGLYGWGWFWFKGFAEGGQQQLKVASWSAGGCDFTCAKVNKTIGSYTFSAWSLDANCTYEGSTGGYKGIFSHDLPLPIYLKVGSSSGGSSNYFEYTLTGLQLQ